MVISLTGSCGTPLVCVWYKSLWMRTDFILQLRQQTGCISASRKSKALILEENVSVIQLNEKWIGPTDCHRTWCWEYPDRQQKWESCKSGKKAKDRIIVLLCASAACEMQRLLVTWKSQNAWSFRGYLKTSLGVDYHANSKAWWQPPSLKHGLKTEQLDHADANPTQEDPTLHGRMWGTPTHWTRAGIPSSLYYFKAQANGCLHHPDNEGHL